MSATTMKVGDRVEVVGKDVQGKVGLDILLEARLCREQNPVSVRLRSGRRHEHR